MFASNRDCITAFLLSLSAMHVASAGAQGPVLEKIDVFRAGSSGYTNYRIPGMIVTTRGVVLAYCEARQKGDWGTIDIVLRRSTDGGKTWEPQKQIAHFGPPVPKHPAALRQKLATEDEKTVNNPVAIVDRQQNAVHFLYCVEYARCFYMRSDDDGKTFSPPVDITAAFESFRPSYDWHVLATGPTHGIQLKNGRLVVPVWLSTGAGRHAHNPSVASVIYSDDHGKSWRTGEFAAKTTDSMVNPNETCVVQLTDGRVMLNIRNQSSAHRRLVSYSRDGATGWTLPVFHDQLLEPLCAASMIRLTEQAAGGDRNRILFANPHNLSGGDGKEAPGMRRDRKNLSIKLTYDEGVSWPVHKTLEAGGSGYSDLAVLPDGTILCLYERPLGNTKAASLTVARFNLAWLQSVAR